MNLIQIQNPNKMISYTNYKDQLSEAMKICNDVENSIFIGQQIVWKGNPMSTTLDFVDKSKMIEVPVMEETQMGMSLGLAMTGKFVVTFYPRWDFLISATNQLINHIDKYSLMTGVTPHIIIRVGKGSDKPLDPGHQHKGNYMKEFNSMLKTVGVLDCQSTQDIQTNYEYAIKNKGIYIINEYPEKYYN
jgi:pyruvate/2-oxoglutarate/acetoin dehydrogenase E1 component